jgi:uncharacterized membrane protein
VALIPVTAVLWSLLVLASPWLGVPGKPRGLAFVSAATYLVGSLVCHQRPERSFHVAGIQLPVCARCTGLYVSGTAGVLLAGVLFRAGRPAPGGRLRSTGRFAASDWRAWLTVAALPTGATWAAEWVGIGNPSNVVRAAAALPLGAVVGVMLVVGLSFRGRLHQCEPRP